MKIYKLFRYALASLCIAFSFSGMAQQAGRNGVGILNFNVEKSQDRVHINWITYSNINTNYFEIEKSDGGKNFKTVW